MICINCSHENTAVINSRTHKKQPSIWRRRRCENCHTTFTTYERPSFAAAMPISLSPTAHVPFSPGKLTLSIAQAFSHTPAQAGEYALSLAQTVEETLYGLRRELTIEDVTRTTHAVLRRFDELAALQYGAQHQLISSVRRRGRPSLASHEPPTPPLPSR